MNWRSYARKSAQVVDDHNVPFHEVATCLVKELASCTALTGCLNITFIDDNSEFTLSSELLHHWVTRIM